MRELMTPPDPPKRPIGFVIDDKDSKASNSKAGKKVEGKAANRVKKI